LDSHGVINEWELLPRADCIRTHMYFEGHLTDVDRSGGAVDANDVYLDRHGLVRVERLSEEQKYGNLAAIDVADVPVVLRYPVASALRKL